MIAYVESNFVLELALGQEQSAAAESILVLAEQDNIELAIPGFALSEPFATITHRGREQVKLGNTLSSTIREFQRSTPHQQAAAQLTASLAILRGIATVEMQRLQDTTLRLLNIGTVIPLDAALYRSALAYRERLGLTSQDSIIYAAIITDLRTRALSEGKYFISKNWRDFQTPDILAELRALGCTYAQSFDDGLMLLKS